MTSKERLLAVLNHQLPDRVPISTYELVGWNENSWENQQPSYSNLMEYIRQKTDCMYMINASFKDAYVEQHKEVETWEENGDLLIRTIIKTPKGDLTKLDRKPADINTVWHIERLVKDDMDIERFLSIPNDPKEVDISHFKERSEYLADRGILLVDFADPLCIVAELFEFGDFTVCAFTQQDLFIKLLDKVFELQMYYLKNMLEKGAGPLFRIIGPEYATEPYLNPELFHSYVYEYDDKIIRLIHDYGQYARIHCHGRIRNILPYIMKMEADAIDPVEAPPSGDIALEEVKKKYGKNICLMGNIQLRDLECCQPEEIRAIVIECMRAAKEGGNYVLMPTASPINAQLSPLTEQNYMVMIDTALEYGQY